MKTNEYGDFPKLSEEGYYIRRSKGTYKGKPHEEYEVVKDISETERTVYCLLNKKAAMILRNNNIMMTKTLQNQVIWHYRPESLNFTGKQLEEPLKITFHEN